VTVTVRYPFHPLVGQSLAVIGSREHGGARHLIVCKPNNKTRCLLPEWMTFPEAGTIRIVACPRLSVNSLIALRAFVDRLMASCSGQRLPGGQSDEATGATPIKSVQGTAGERAIAVSASESTGTAKSASQRGNVRHRSRKRKHRKVREVSG